MSADDGSNNDARGWVLCAISAAACVAGASLVCIDVFVRLLPGKKSFHIQDSSAFLSASLSLSFGVMIFSSIFSMLPSSKRYLADAGLNEQVASLLMMAAYGLGFLGMQVVSRVLHRFMPSHVVDCDHSHGDDPAGGGPSHAHAHPHAFPHAFAHGHRGGPMGAAPHSYAGAPGPAPTESTPLLGPLGLRRQSSARSDAAGLLDGGAPPRAVHSRRPLAVAVRRPSMTEVRNHVISFFKDAKSNCDESGPCYGYSDPCGQECKRNFAVRTPTSSVFACLAGAPAAPGDAATDAALPPPPPPPPHHHGWESSIPAVPEEAGGVAGGSAAASRLSAQPSASGPESEGPPSSTESSTAVSSHGPNDAGADDASAGSDLEAGVDERATQQQQQHHHHVPANAFLAIGLQTVLAIGLHKFPEGFVTFATNHANPALGFNVFLALLVHNVAEGFAMALPLYMAWGSRLRAIALSAALGGLSQPLGAGAAALWLRYLGRNGGDGGGGAGNGKAYGVLFAVTAGIMVAVALQLFIEGLTLHHNRQLTIGFAFLGMMLMGLSSAIGAH